MKYTKKVIVLTQKLSDEIKYQGTTILTYSIEYPKFVSIQHTYSIIKMNIFYEKMARKYETYIKTILKDMAIKDYEESIKNGYPVHKYEAVFKYTLTYNQNCGISLYQDKYEYTGGAHGNTVRTSQTWDIKNGRQIPLKSLFPGNPRYVHDLKAEINKQIASQIKDGTGAYFDDYKKLVDKTFNTDSFYLTPEALVIYFQQYDIAPYSSGIPEFSIPYRSVGAKLFYC